MTKNDKNQEDVLDKDIEEVLDEDVDVDVDVDEDLEEDEDIDEDIEDDDVEEDDRDKKIAELKKKNGILNRKLTKANKGTVKKKVSKKAAESNELSSKDMFSIINAKIGENDIDEVIKASKLLGLSIKDTLQDDTLKAIIAKRVEFRKTSKAANKGAARASGKKLSDHQLLENANKGVLPEPGSEEAEALYWAKRGGRK